MMARGMRAMRPEKPKVAEAPAVKGKIRMKTPEAALERADIKAAEGTKEWHGEVLQAVAAGKAAPEVVQSSAKVEAARLVLAKAETQENIKFLLNNGEPRSEIVTVVMADIAGSDFRNDPAYLVAKEAQLVHSLKSDMVLSEQVEIGKAAKNIHEYIRTSAEVRKTANPPEVVNVSDMLQVRVVSVVEDKVQNNRQKAEEKDKKTQDEDEENIVYFLDDLKESVNEILIVSAGGDIAIETKIRLLNMPDETAVFLSKQMLDGKKNINEALKEYAKKVGAAPYGKEQATKKFVTELSDVLGDPEIKKMMLDQKPVEELGASGAEIWDATKKSGNDKLDDYLKKQQHLMDTTDLKDDPRKLDKILEHLQDAGTDFTPEQLEAVGNPQTKITEMKKAAEAEYRRLQREMRKQESAERGESINEQYSSIYLAPTVRKLTVLYPEWGFNQMYQKFNEAVGFDTRGVIPQQLSRQLSQVVEYYAGTAFVSDIKELMANPEYRAEIAKATGVEIPLTDKIDPETGKLMTDMKAIEQHPFYVDRVKRLRELSRIIQAKDNIDYSYGVMKMGMDIQKQQVGVLGALGDRGIMDIKADGGFINGTADHILDDFGDIAKWNERHGYKQRIGDKEMEQLQNNTRYVLESNKKEFGKYYTRHFQSRASIANDGKYDYSELCKKIGITNATMEFSPDVIQGVVREAQKLNTVTLREVYARVKALSPGASDGQNFQGPKYGGESGLNSYLQARQMYEQLFERWDLLDPASMLHMRIMAHQYAEVSGVDKVAALMANRAMRDPSYKLKIAADMLEVHDMDSAVRAKRIEDKLKFHFSKDLDGYTVKNRPTTIEALTEKQLIEIINFKEGMKYADMVIGGYGYEGASWVAESKTLMYDLIYDKDSWMRGIGIGDMKRHLGSEFVGAETAHDREKIAHKLMGTEDNPGILRKQGEYLTTRSMQDLIEHQHYETLQKHAQMADGHFYEGVFSDIRTKEPITIKADRPDLAIGYMKITDRVTDELLSFEGQGPINWHKGPTAEQDKVLTTVCNNMGVNKEKFIKLKKEWSDFVLKEPQLERLTMSDMVDTYFDVQDLESREKFLDHPLEAPGSHYEQNRQHADASVIDRVSGLIGEESGKSEKCGIARLAGDNGRAAGSAGMVAKLLGIRSPEPLQKAMPELRDNILFTFGRQFASRGVEVVGGSWIKMVSMDAADDWGVVGSVFTLRENSPIKRVTHLTGDHGDMAITLNERHELWTQLQKDVKDAFESDMAEGLNVYMEKELGLVWEYTGLDGKHHHTKAPWFIYTYYLAALAALGITLGLAAKTAKEGVDEGMSAGGGGGGAPPHP